MWISCLHYDFISCFDNKNNICLFTNAKNRTCLQSSTRTKKNNSHIENLNANIENNFTITFIYLENCFSYLIFSGGILLYFYFAEHETTMKRLVPYNNSSSNWDFKYYLLQHELHLIRDFPFWTLSLEFIIFVIQLFKIISMFKVSARFMREDD